MATPSVLERFLYLGRLATAPPEHRSWAKQVVAMDHRIKQVLMLLAPNIAIVVAIGVVNIAVGNLVLGTIIIALALAAPVVSLVFPKFGDRRLRGFAAKHGVSSSLQ